MPPDKPTTLQQQIRDAMDERGITIVELAALAGYHASHVGRALAGNPTAETLHRLAAALGLRWVLME